jgi:hypothetical protein
MARILMCLAGALALFAVVAPRAQGTREWPTYPIKAAPNELRPSIQYGDSIILSIQNAVLSELSRELADVGPAGAVRVCHMSANTVAYWIGREERVAGGRTSARLRSPANAPQPWAAPVVARFTDRRASGMDGFAVGPRHPCRCDAAGRAPGRLLPLPRTRRAVDPGRTGRAAEAVSAGSRDRLQGRRSARVALGRGAKEVGAAAMATKRGLARRRRVAVSAPTANPTVVATCRGAQFR